MLLAAREEERETQAGREIDKRPFKISKHYPAPHYYPIGSADIGPCISQNHNENSVFPPALEASLALPGGLEAVALAEEVRGDGTPSESRHEPRLEAGPHSHSEEKVSHWCWGRGGTEATGTQPCQVP